MKARDMNHDMIRKTGIRRREIDHRLIKRGSRIEDMNHVVIYKV